MEKVFIRDDTIIRNATLTRCVVNKRLLLRNNLELKNSSLFSPDCFEDFITNMLSSHLSITRMGSIKNSILDCSEFISDSCILSSENERLTNAKKVLVIFCWSFLETHIVANCVRIEIARPSLKKAETIA
jgi:hypothetical protein